MELRLGLLAATTLLMPCATARAYVLVAVPDGADELARELELELGPDSRVVCEGSDEEAPIDAHVSLVRDRERTEIQVTHRALATPLRSATAPDADPRTLAIVAAELIVEADERFLDGLPRLLQPVSRRASAATAVRAHSFRATELVIGRPRSDDGDAGLTFGVGLGGFVAANRDQSREGTQLRALVGYRFDERFRLGALLEGGVITEPLSNRAHFEPWGRACLEGAIGTPARPVAVYIAAHQCVLVARHRARAALSLEDRAGTDPRFGDYAEHITASLSFGGAVAVAVATEGVHFWLRVDVDGAGIGLGTYVMTVLSLIVGTA